VTAFGCGACGGGSNAQKPNVAGYLVVVKSPIIGSLASSSDTTLVGIGRRACADFDAGERSDAVVADLSGGALPGSADFNSYSMVAATAARDLCPQHASEFASDPAIASP